jgi:hypothetical protein
MTIENLDYFPTLQVPEIDFIVFAARNDPFSTCDAKTRCNAIFRVGMARVGLEAAGGVVVPQSDGAVVRGGEDVF